MNEPVITRVSHTRLMARGRAARRLDRGRLISITRIALLIPLIFTMAFGAVEIARASASQSEHLRFDDDWRFAFGHPFDPDKDFGHATGYFSYFAKAGYGDGAAASGFDDRAWRTLSLPHDWAVELPFDPKGGFSHGFRKMGPNFPETSVGWYRKHFNVPASDLGRKISIQFDGIFRDSQVWINGYYLGRQTSGYTGSRYDLTDYLNYDGENVVAVRVDAMMEEGWFYEGAGIYRHVWLDKQEPLHLAPEGVSVTTELNSGAAQIAIEATVSNEGTEKASFDVAEEIRSADGLLLASHTEENVAVAAGEAGTFPVTLSLASPKLWSLENPYLHRLITTVLWKGAVVDRRETPFGIRSIRFDPDRGFFLNGVRVELKGTNEHQDLGGLGVAIPDSLQVYRVNRLKSMGANAIRTAHNPPSPEFLDACDRLGMLVLDETRRMGTSPEILEEFRQMILRDRNHPCVVLWSMGNEEWSMEGNVTGARVASAMQAFGRKLDPTREFTAACSGGWEGGIGTVTEVMGYNYIVQGDIDLHHRLFPAQSGVGTEETTTRQTRGIYFDDPEKAYIGQTYRLSKWGCEAGWQFYAERPFLAGLFYWTGFDYGGEPHPYGWPEVSSQSGILDNCGFPKDSFYYLKSWWTNEPVLHVFPHWNWGGREGTRIPVKVYGNADEVELVLNGTSLGRKPMPKNGSIEWSVPYHPGTLAARGYKNGALTVSDVVETTGDASRVVLSTDTPDLEGNGRDAAFITVRIVDRKGRTVPTADPEIKFSISGPGRIIAVGNGDPTSHEPSRFIEAADQIKIHGWKMRTLGSVGDPMSIADEPDGPSWQSVFSGLDQKYPADKAVYRGTISVVGALSGSVSLLLPPLGDDADVFINGKKVAGETNLGARSPAIALPATAFSSGNNEVVVIAKPFPKPPRSFDYTSPGSLLVLGPPAIWRRKAFNGLAAVVVQAADSKGTITLVASGPGLTASQQILVVRQARKAGPMSGSHS
jgi:beta-galactosidase